MKKNDDDLILLKDLCQKYELNFDKVEKLIEVTKEFEIKDTRNGIYNALKEIIENRNF